MSKVISINTSFGTLFARTIEDPEYPGIEVYMLDKNGAEISLAVIEAIPGGESCDAENHINGDITHESRIEYRNIDLWSGQQITTPVLTAGLMARIWEDYNREDPVSITYHDMPEFAVVHEQLPASH